MGPPLLIGLVPVLMLAHFLYVWTIAGPHDIHFLNRVFFFHALGPQFVLATMVGVAIAAGFAPRLRG